MFTKADIEKYFNAEKQESLLFLFIGIAGIIAAIVFFFFLKTSFYKGAAIPLLLVGLLLGVIGYAVYKRSDGDRKRNVYAYDMNSSELKEKELPRMKTVMKNFVIYRYTEIFLLLVGIALYIFFIKDFKNDFWRGFGVALAVMALLALVADYFAEKRGKVYTKGIESFVNKNKGHGI
jgi:membrane protein implicated in regulation of membrane protease activity